MSEKWTPGPWRLDYIDGYSIDSDASSYATQHICAGRKAPVCIVYDPGLFDGKLEANARLIASAPALAEACRLWMAFAEDDFREVPMIAHYRRAVEATRAALRAATGGGDE